MKMAILKGCTVLLCSVLLLSSEPCDAEKLPSPELVNQWARNLKNALIDSFMASSDYDMLKNSHAGDLSHVWFAKVNPKAELASMASKITEIFTKRTKALKDIVTAAEEKTFTYTYDPKLQLEDVELFKMADYNTSSAELTYSGHFGREVNLQQSGVHTPLEVYEGYLDVLNGLKWSAAVDETFRNNARRDPTISWQYLGSQLGFMRVFPATWWQAPAALEGVDLYDVRRRPWYIEGSVSPKDVVILMDISGSVYGQTFEIMKIAVKTVLNTLGENDYVNIAWSTNRVGWVNPCIDTLVPATMINKRALFAAVDALEARNTSDWSKGLNFSYNAFVDFYSSQPEHAGANCHKLIMFFSDGGTEWPGEIIDKYKNETLTKDVRLFAYALGPHPVPSHVLRQMACKNGGFFSVIVATGAIRTTVQESYTPVLGRPLALSGSHPVSESSPYWDAGGLGYVTTLSMPVFNRSEASDGQSLLGVAGVDITMDEIRRHAPWKKLGPFGYTFAINPNGIVLFHPRLREPLHYMEDPPDLDLTLVEGSNNVVKDLRTQMIRRNANSVLMDKSVVLPDGYTVDMWNLSYTYQPVDNTTLSLGLVVPHGQSYVVVSGQPASAGLPPCDACLVAPAWDYCPGLTAEGVDRWQQLSDLLRNNSQDCESSLVQQLVRGARWTAEVPPLWEQHRDDGVAVRFVVTDGGLTRFHPADSGDDLASEADPYRSGLYLQSALTDDLVFRPRPKLHRVAAAQRIAVSNSTGGVYTLAVVGVQYNASRLRSLVERVVAGAEPDRPACSEEAGVRCWLLDSAGYVLYSSRLRRALGRHLGSDDPELMAALVNASVFSQEVVYDYQGVCRKKRQNVSAASPLPDPLGWLNLRLLLDSAAGLLRWLEYLRYLLASALLSARAAPAAALDEFGFEIHAYEHSCTQRLVRTQLKALARPYQGVRRCPVGVQAEAEVNCSRSFRAAPVGQTNLVLVVADLPCGCPKPADGELPFQPEEDVGPDRCDEDKTPLFRRRPDTCFATHENEKPACSGGGRPAAAPLLLALAVLSGLAGAAS